MRARCWRWFVCILLGAGLLALHDHALIQLTPPDTAAPLADHAAYLARLAPHGVGAYFFIDVPPVAANPEILDALAPLLHAAAVTMLRQPLVDNGAAIRLLLILQLRTPQGTLTPCFLLETAAPTLSPCPLLATLGMPCVPVAPSVFSVGPAVCQQRIAGRARTAPPQYTIPKYNLSADTTLLGWSAITDRGLLHALAPAFQPLIASVTSQAVIDTQLRLRWQLIAPRPEQATALHNKLESILTAGLRATDVSPWLTPILRSTKLQRIEELVTVELAATPGEWRQAIQYFTVTE
ncbi:MAG: hypothetical protein HY696_12105 [Deltaproteobacteria bacterium]|nr:hypothetical protein [Deltaproteobacteria bacterium]